MKEYCLEVSVKDLVSSSKITVYTIGHGRHPFDYFLALLNRYQIKSICDVRSAPRSRWPQFNRLVLAEALRQNDIGYEHLPECGGKVLAPPPDLARGLDRIIDIANDVPVAIMCSESQPITNHKQPHANCHRFGMLAPKLKALGADVIHILPTGLSLKCDESSYPSVW